jgi:hypothetical protein
VTHGTPGQAVFLGIGRLVSWLAWDWVGFVCCSLRGDKGVESRGRPLVAGVGYFETGIG